MKKIWIAALTAVLMSGCTAGSSIAESAKDEQNKLGYEKITIGLDDTFAPMGFRDDNGNLTGFDVELAEEAAEILGVEVEFQPIDWSMKETELNSGSIDCIWNGYSITEERKEKVLFSDAYLDNKQIIIVLADSGIDSADDLAGKTVAVQKDSSALYAVTADTAFTDALLQGAPIEFDTNIECFLDLEEGRADAIVTDEVLARYVMKQRGEEQYKVLDDDFGTEEYAVGFRKEDTVLCAAVNDALQQLKDNGTYQRIYSKWFSNN